MQLKLKSNSRPECETEAGCPIEDIAPNPRAEDIITTFIEAKTLYITTKLPDVQLSMFERIGLLEDTELLMKFEGVWNQYLLIQQNKRLVKIKSKRKKK